MVEKKKMSKGKKVLSLMAGFGLLGVLFFAGIEITCTSWFCTSCHEMRSLGNSWELSKHGPMNPKIHNCMKCHAQPGPIGFVKAKVNGLFSLVYHITGNYHVEATQPVVCIRGGCHQMEDLDRAYRPDQVVLLNHAKHIKIMEEIGTRHKCMPCHRNIAHGEGKFLPDMKKDCFLCHTEGFQKICADNCNTCHADHLELALKDNQGVDLFELHTQAEIACLECHSEEFKTVEASCQACHDGEEFGEIITNQRELPQQNKVSKKDASLAN